MEPYHSYFPHAGLLLTETERLVERILSLPTSTAIEESEIGQICQTVYRQLQKTAPPACANGRQVSLDVIFRSVPVSVNREERKTIRIITVW